MKRTNVADAMAARGFFREGTGGGCDAWAVYFADGSYIYVTEAQNPAAPTSWRGAVSVSVWRSVDVIQESADFTFPTLRAALSSLDGWLAIAERVTPEWATR